MDLLFRLVQQNLGHLELQEILALQLFQQDQRSLEYQANLVILDSLGRPVSQLTLDFLEYRQSLEFRPNQEILEDQHFPEFRPNQANPGVR